jgi:GTP-binding protein
MLLHHRILLLLPSIHSSSTTASSTLLRPSRFLHCLPLSPRTSALSHLAVPQPIDHSDSEEVQVQLPLDRLFLPPGQAWTRGTRRP